MKRLVCASFTANVAYSCDTVRCSFSRGKSSTIFVYIAEPVMRPNGKRTTKVRAGEIQLDGYRFLFTMFLQLHILRTNKRNGTRLSMFNFSLFLLMVCEVRCTNTPKSQIGDNSGGNVRSLCVLLAGLFAVVFVVMYYYQCVTVCLQNKIHTRTEHAKKMNTSIAPTQTIEEHCYEAQTNNAYTKKK